MWTASYFAERESRSCFKLKKRKSFGVEKYLLDDGAIEKTSPDQTQVKQIDGRQRSLINQEAAVIRNDSCGFYTIYGIGTSVEI